MGKKNRPKAKKSAKKSKGSAAASSSSSEVSRLIDSVSDSDIENCRFGIPSDEIMDEVGIPKPFIKGHNLQWFCDNLCIALGEWGSALVEVLIEDGADIDDPNVDNFAKYSPEKQSEYRKRMTDIVRRNARIPLFWKWKFAKDRDDREAQWQDAAFLDFEDDVGDESQGIGGEDEDVGEESQGFGEDEDVGAEDSQGIGEDVGEEGCQRVDEEVGEGSLAVDKEEQDMVIWQGGDNFYDAVGYYPFPHTMPPFDANTVSYSTVFIDFPRHRGDDVILLYKRPFSLASWFQNHLDSSARWLTGYRDWGGGKLTRECSGIVQGLLCCWLNHAIGREPHGGMNDMRNYIISQHVENHRGAKKVKFSVELMNRNDESATSLGHDVEHFISVLLTLFQGGILDSEMQNLPEMLRVTVDYPTGYIGLVLRDFSGLWDAEERATFFIDLSFRFVCDPLMRDDLIECFQAGGTFGTGIPEQWTGQIPVGWHGQIRVGSIFDDILRYGSSDGSIQYSDYDIVQMLRYIRNTFVHFLDTVDGYQLSLRQVEHILSEIFPDLLLNLYTGMCIRNLFLSCVEKKPDVAKWPTTPFFHYDLLLTLFSKDKR